MNEAEIDALFAQIIDFNDLAPPCLFDQFSPVSSEHGSSKTFSPISEIHSLLSMDVSLEQAPPFWEKYVTEEVTPGMPTRRAIEAACLPVFKEDPDPSKEALRSISIKLGAPLTNAKCPESKKMVQAIRAWFRRRRNENGQRIFNESARMLDGLKFESDAEVSAFLEDEVLVGEILEKAKLEFNQKQVQMTFGLPKIESYIRRKCMFNHAF